MLCQALTGTLPFQGTLPRMLEQKTRDDFEPAGLAEAQPRDLAGLSLALMRPRPRAATRPGRTALDGRRQRGVPGSVHSDGQRLRRP